jgi:hypothetical protein
MGANVRCFLRNDAAALVSASPNTRTRFHSWRLWTEGLCVGAAALTSASQGETTKSDSIHVVGT